jgi:hypothetical protein
MTRTAPARWISLLVPTFAAASIGVGLAQDVAYRVTLETPPGAPVAAENLAAGDVVVLEVALENRGADPVAVDEIWLVVPPVEGASRFGNAGDGFSFPDRMRQPDGVEVPWSREAAPDLTHLHGLSDPLGPGARVELAIRLTILSSVNGVAELMEAVYLEGGDGDRIGRRVADF